VMGFLEIGSHKLFAWAGFKPGSSWSLPPEYLGLQVHAISASLRHTAFLIAIWKIYHSDTSVLNKNECFSFCY
jgi:hypothetical protein